jgi:CheY-like chemotaxis protein
MEDKNKLEEFERLIFEKKERLKELACINKTTQIVREGKSLEETLSKIVKILPDAWQYPEMTSARIRFNGKEYKTANFWETEWKQGQSFHTINGRRGEIEVFYIQKFRDMEEGPFMKEERDLINNLSMIIQNYIDSIEAREVLTESKEESSMSGAILEFKEPRITGRHLLQRFLNKQNANRDIFHDLMPFRVKDILLVATLYDAFSIEKEGRFGDHILGEYQQLHLSSIPKVTGATSFEEAIELMSSQHFDLVILMIGNDIRTPLGIAGKVKKDFPYIPIYVLLNSEKDINIIKESPRYHELVDQLFVWSGDSKIFFAMVKHLEDKVNVAHDTKIGLIKIILLVEDSPKYYSRYLPFLYSMVMEQTQRLIDEVSTDDIFKILRRRARPKILLATNYEQAINIVNTYGEDLLCLMTDVRFEKDGIMNDAAGFQLVLQVHSLLKGLPVIIQSTEPANMEKAFELKAFFINKNSETLHQDIESFIKHHLGFGNIIYKDSTGKTIAEARSLKEFEEHIDTLPVESLIYHGKRNHFSLWLMARGEIKIAKMIYPVKVSDFKTPAEFRNYLKFVIRKYRNETDVGKVINFEDASIPDKYNVVSLGSGALGGKGRGLAFINSMIYNLNFGEVLPSLKIRTPVTMIIGTDEFEMFMKKNNLNESVSSAPNYDSIKDSFLDTELSYNLEKKLRMILKTLISPLAVRSSSSLEDSSAHPFSGIFTTYIIPNNHPDFNVRLKQLTDAIKLVYASVFSDQAKSYYEAVNFRIEDEKMAIVLQELAGNQFDQYFYPHISGTAQSYNYYPFSHMKPEDGFAVAAVGLGQYVMEGEKAYRFSPKYPDSDINTPKELLKSTQVNFYALNMKNDELLALKTGENATLSNLEISEAEKHGTINHSVSVYDMDNDRIFPGLDTYGPRIVNFANILKYEHIPLAKAIELVLDVGKEAMGSPIEIEFAVDLNKDENGRATFYLLQIKPLLGSAEDYQIDQQKLNKDKIILIAEKSMGNGKIDDIQDVIYVDPDKFDKTRTREMVAEIDRLNYKMRQEGKKYVLIGPGRWGTRDRFIGIPVAWPQISNAKVIVEMNLEDFPLDASLGSHFFHNVTSMNVGYFTVQNTFGNDCIQWEILRKQRVINETSFFNHVRFNDPLTIVMDGKKRMSVIMLNNL